MKTNIFVLSALFASCGAVKFVPSDTLQDTELEDIQDNNNVLLDAKVNVRTELQQKLRAYLYGPPLPKGIPGASDKAQQPFARSGRNIELRFHQPRLPVEYPYPQWILPGSEPIMPKKSSDMDYLDDETDRQMHYHWVSNYSPKRKWNESNLQLENSEEQAIMLEAEEKAELRKKTRAELKQMLRSFLERDSKYPYDKYPVTILPGSTPIMPKKSAPMDLYDGALDDSYHKNHRSSYNPRTHKYDNFINLQLDARLNDDEITVEQARIQAAQMQAQMDKAVADADEKRAEQQAQYEANISNNDPAAQLKGLMNAQQSLHRLTSVFSNKPNMDKVNGMAQKLGIPMTPELMQLGSNEAISNALVEIAVGMGKSENEIEKALD